MNDDIHAITEEVVKAFSALRDAINTTSEGGLQNDRALLTLCTAIVEKVDIIETRFAELVLEVEAKHAELVHRTNVLNDKVNILHEIYTTHFHIADDDNDDKGTVN
jgi:hypothetical protein